MTACLLADSGALSILPETAPNSCTGYILMTPAEYSANQSPFAEFDLNMFGAILAFMFTIVVTGFYAGFTVRKMRI